MEDRFLWGEVKPFWPPLVFGTEEASKRTQRNCLATDTLLARTEEPPEMFLYTTCVRVELRDRKLTVVDGGKPFPPLCPVCNKGHSCLPLSDYRMPGTGVVVTPIGADVRDTISGPILQMRGLEG